MVSEPSLSFDPIAEAARQWTEHGWASAALGMSAVTSITRVAQILLHRVDTALKPLGLTFARYEILALLSFARSGALPLGKIGDRLQVHPASVTSAVDRLERESLVCRVPNPRDGRGILAQITPRGRRLAARATAILNARVFEAVDLEDSELERLVRLLAEVRHRAGDFP